MYHLVRPVSTAAPCLVQPLEAGSGTRRSAPDRPVHPARRKPLVGVHLHPFDTSPAAHPSLRCTAGAGQRTGANGANVQTFLRHKALGILVQCLPHSPAAAPSPSRWESASLAVPLVRTGSENCHARGLSSLLAGRLSTPSAPATPGRRRVLVNAGICSRSARHPHILRVIVFGRVKPIESLLRYVYEGTPALGGRRVQLNQILRRAERVLRHVRQRLAQSM